MDRDSLMEKLRERMIEKRSWEVDLNIITDDLFFYAVMHYCNSTISNDQMCEVQEMAESFILRRYDGNNE